jgi:ABC-type lipoprotein release transport system permease subunit
MTGVMLRATRTAVLLTRGRLTLGSSRQRSPKMHSPVGSMNVAGLLVMTVKPQFLVAIEPSAIIVTLAAGFVMALTGALVPARAVAALAPAEVFRR